jgi:hypothetical protein
MQTRQWLSVQPMVGTGGSALMGAWSRAVGHVSMRQMSDCFRRSAFFQQRKQGELPQ